MADLTVLDGGKSARPHFIGEDILRAAVEFVDAHMPRLSFELRADAVFDAARVIVDAELTQ